MHWPSLALAKKLKPKRKALQSWRGQTDVGWNKKEEKKKEQ